MTGYSEGKHDDPADTQDRLVKVGSKYQATAPAVADGDNVYFLVDAAGRLLITGSVAHDAVAAGNPVKIGAVANDNTPTAVANGDAVDLRATTRGALYTLLSGRGSTNDGGESSAVGVASPGSNSNFPLAVFLKALAPDGNSDRLRTLGDAAPGLGALAVGTRSPGASEVKSERVVTATDSSVRSTMVTPTSGKKIRVISAHFSNGGTTGARLEVYFGTGANIGTNSTSAVFQAVLDLDTVPNATQAWPDRGGPIGAADEVVSIRTGVDITTNGEFIVHYREE